MTSVNVFSCPWFAIYEQDSYFELRNHQEQVVVLPLLPSGDIVFVRVLRQLFSTALWELPAGAVEPEETPLDAAMRELNEETGIHAFEVGLWTELSPVAVMPNRMSERAHVFHVTISESAWDSRSSHDSEVEKVARFSEEELTEMLSTGSLNVALPMAVVLRYLLLTKDYDVNLNPLP